MEGPGFYVVVGCGQVGYRVACLLLALGERVSVLSRDVRPDWRRRLEENGARVLEGDANDQELLVQAGVAEARAVLALTSDDATNIRITLESKRVDPQIKVVARLFDQNLAQRLEAGIGLERALAMSVVAAPSFASAALGTEVVGEFQLANKRFLLVRKEVHPASRLTGMTPQDIKGRFGAETVLRIGPDGNPTTDVGHQEPLVTGETIKVIGEQGTLVSLVPAASQHKPKHRRSTVGAKSLWGMVPASLKVLSTIVVALTVLSTVIFDLAMGLSPLDAFYFVVTTLTTTGYGDITPKATDPWLKVYTCVLMILGSAIVAVLYSIITDLIVTTRFRELAGVKPVPERDHVVVVGLGDVGYRIVEELRDSGLEVAVVDSDPDTPYAIAARTRVAVVTGDGREPETLEKANVATARSVVVSTGNDAVNLSVGLLAKQLAPEVRVVLRIFDAGFANAVHEILNIDEALSASRLAAPEFVAAALYPDTIAAFYLRDHLICLTRSGEGGRKVEVGGAELFVQSRVLVRPDLFEKS